MELNSYPSEKRTRSNPEQLGSAINPISTSHVETSVEQVQLMVEPDISARSSSAKFVKQSGVVLFNNPIDKFNCGSPFVHVNAAMIEKEVETLVNETIHGKWDLPKPSLIVSVTGGAKDFNMRKKVS